METSSIVPWKTNNEGKDGSRAFVAFLSLWAGMWRGEEILLTETTTEHSLSPVTK